MGFSFEEWKKEYMKDAPAQPFSESENPEQWAKIALYMEDMIQEAFEAGFISCAKEYDWHYLKNGDVPPYVDKEYLFYLAAKNEHGSVSTDTWGNKKNNRYVIAWAEFNAPEKICNENDFSKYNKNSLCMAGNEYINLGTESMQHTVASLSYSGKEAVATVAIMTLKLLGLTPAQIAARLETE